MSNMSSKATSVFLFCSENYARYHRKIFLEKYTKQACPLCDTTAEYCLVDHRAVKYFDCPRCGKFQISKPAEKMLHEKLRDRKPAYSRRVKETPEEHLFFIGMPLQEFRLQSVDPLQTGFKPKSELSLTCN